MNGKGDKKRPMQISSEEFDKNFNTIFGKPKEKKDANKIKTKPEVNK
jgi:hypothetical protein